MGIVVIFEDAALPVCAPTQRQGHGKYSVAPVVGFCGEIAIDSHILGDCTQPSASLHIIASSTRSANDDYARVH